MVKRLAGAKTSKLAVLFTAVSIILTAPMLAEEIPEIKILEVIGTGIIQNKDLQTARERAVSSALTTAVETVITNLLPVESRVRNFKPLHAVLNEQIPTVILNYRILAENQYQDSYKVLVRASISVPKLKHQLANHGIMANAPKKPEILLLMAEQKLDDLYPRYRWEAARSESEFPSDNAMAEIFRQEGFNVIDYERLHRDEPLYRLNLTPEINTEDALQLASRLGADAVILGRSTVQPATNTIEDGIRSYTGNINARFFLTKTGETSASTTQSATTTHPDKLRGSLDALSEAATLAAKALLFDISGMWQEANATVQKIEIQVTGSEYSIGNFITLRRILKTIEGVEEIQTRQMQSQAAFITADFNGKAQMLAQALTQKPCEQFALNIIDITDNHLKIQLDTLTIDTLNP